MSSFRWMNSVCDLWKRLALAAIGLCTMAVGVASAQTVIVTRVPTGMTVELGVNREVVDSAAAGKDGWVTLVTKRLAGAKAGEEVSVTIFVDRCDDLRRVMLVEPGQQPLGSRAGCTRQAISGVYVMRPKTTFVVETADAPSVRLRQQGSVPKDWLVVQETRASSSRKTSKAFGPMPAGLVLFAGGGFSTFTSFTEDACGNVSECNGKNTQPGWSAGLTYWLNPVIGLEASYIQPGTVEATGQSSIQSFGSTRESRLLFFGGKVGGSSGRARVYGQFGAIYGWSLTTVAQNITDRPVTVGDKTVTIVGGAQQFQMETKGWSWGAGGGLEVWIKPKFGIYTEVDLLWLKGEETHQYEGKVDDRAWTFMAGARFRLR